VFETLRNFAEIGIAIAGFSGIVAALGSRPLSAWSLLKRERLLILLETAGFVVLFALVPQVLSQLRFTELSLWRTCNLLYVAAGASHAALTIFRARRQLAQGAISTREPLLLPIAIGILLILAQLAVLVFGDLDHLKFIYLLLLSWHAFCAAVLFVNLILRAFDRDAA